MKSAKLTVSILVFAALALCGFGAQATVVNTLLRDTTPPNTDILCRSTISSTLVQNCWTARNAPGNGSGNPGNNEILDYFDGIVPGFDSNDLLYKSEYGGGEEGSLTASYSTSFDKVGDDVLHATISHDGGPAADCSSLADPCFLLIKGGQTPYAFLFNLALGWDPDPGPIGGDGHGWSSNALGIPSWNGMMDLTAMNFGTLGSISYVALYGNSGVSAVPVPAAFWLFGTALLGFIGLSRSTRI
jgi:hypothetical protein